MIGEYKNGKTSGQRTSEEWTFLAHQETRLQPWQEIIGTYEALEVGEDNVILTLSRTRRNLKITFVKNSAEAQKLTQALINTAKGTKIALLKTDDPQKPSLLRVLTQP